MKTLNPHPHVIKLLGCITESGKLSKMYWLALHFTGLYLHYGIKSGSTVSVFDKFFLLNSAMVLVFLSPTQINTDSFLHVLNHINNWNMDFPGHSLWAVHYFSLRKKHIFHFTKNPCWYLSSMCHMEISLVTWERAVDSMTLITTIQTSNHEQVWCHSSWWNLLGK